MKRRFVISHRYTFLPKTEDRDQSSVDQHLCMLCFYRNIRTGSFFFCGHNILAEGVFVTQLSSNVRIAVGQIVWDFAISGVICVVTS